MDADLATLCRACGMCCDGSLFGRVDLEPEEVEPARRHHLHVLENGRAFTQRCTALVGADGGGCRCAIYDERPRACRRFACRLYERHRHDGGPIEARLAAVRRVRELVALLEASGRTPAELDAPDAAVEPDLRHAHRELMQALEEDFARAR